MRFMDNNANVYIDLWNTHDLLDPKNLTKLIDQKYVCHDPSTPKDFGNGPAAFVQRIEFYSKAFPDLNVQVKYTIVADKADPCPVCGSTSVVVQRWEVTGTHQGELFGVKPSNKKTHTQGTSELHFSNDGKLLEEYVNWDAVGLMKQIGAMEVGTSAAA